MTNKEWKGYLTGKETLFKIIDFGNSKARQKFAKHALLGILGGIYIGFSGIQVSITVGGAKGIRESNIGLANFFFGALFSVGFIFSFICGGEIFTDGLVYMFPSFYAKHIKFRNIMSNWLTTFLMNFLGAFISAWLLTYEADLFNKDPYNEWIKEYALLKVSQGWFVLFLKGVMGAYLAGLAFYLATAAQDIFAKILGIFFPILAFGGLGLEHATASMYFIFVGLLYKAPGVTFFKFLWNNLLPVTLGNIIGGSVFVATIYYYLYYPKATVDNDDNNEQDKELYEMMNDDDDELEVPSNVTRVFRARKVTSVVKSDTSNNNKDSESTGIESSSD
ncbi:formate transporter 1-related [Anaeramoeba flamelloides]|uniref:Formate transporter 1-related n=1 Tax=Anaeramoeba flamelloides TaxID=1746091 RepID=A0AAV7YYM2_9EUKA|nr:formate transporter 1-related [Anaeramoeba flamelloides]KAJ6248217.1 formate transporter 1-related [Anaeramoeba flamelloides]